MDLRNFASERKKCGNPDQMNYMIDAQNEDIVSGFDGNVEYETISSNMAENNNNII